MQHPKRKQASSILKIENDRSEYLLKYPNTTKIVQNDEEVTLNIVIPKRALTKVKNLTSQYHNLKIKANNASITLNKLDGKELTDLLEQLGCMVDEEL